MIEKKKHDMMSLTMNNLLVLAYMNGNWTVGVLGRNFSVKELHNELLNQTH